MVRGFLFTAVRRIGLLDYPDYVETSIGFQCLFPVFGSCERLHWLARLSADHNSRSEDYPDAYLSPGSYLDTTCTCD